MPVCQQRDRGGAQDPERPFIVKTGNVSVRVLGTKFNVFAYQGENPNVVLVEGSVDVATAKSGRRMIPGQKVEVVGDKLNEPENVNVDSYISWINNELIYDEEPLASVFRRLQIYYGITVETKNVTLTGCGSQDVCHWQKIRQMCFLP